LKKGKYHTADVANWWSQSDCITANLLIKLKIKRKEHKQTGFYVFQIGLLPAKPNHTNAVPASCQEVSGVYAKLNN